MYDQISSIVDFVISAFIHVWPYLLITIPLAVAVRMSGASKYIKRAFQARPIVAILLATAVGAFSPFCSCGVIPVIAALLMSGVPLAPVMSFWIASPSMDPEAFFLSVSTIGWELAVWRLGATLILSLGAGFVTHLIVERGWLGQDLLRHRQSTSVQPTWALIRRGWQRLERNLRQARTVRLMAKDPVLAAEAVCCSAPATVTVKWDDFAQAGAAAVGTAAGRDTSQVASSGASCDATEANSCSAKPAPFQRRLLEETWDATLMVAKFMALAFFLEALITLYIPDEWIAGLLGRQNPMAILTAAFLGVPVYTSNLAALPMVSGLLAQGMNPAAALAFLIAGPTTTLPAMAAVWGLTSRRVFALYVSFSLAGAVLLGYLYGLVA